MRKFVKSFGLASLILTNNSFANEILYDDFSKPTLNFNKWEEYIGSDFISTELSDHFVSGGMYHTASDTFSDKSITLKAETTFQVGDSFKYDLFYRGGEGNRGSFIQLDNSDSWRYILIGNWNNDFISAGNMFGKYNLRVDFTLNGADISIISPNSEVYNFSLNSPGETHKIGFGTRTGHNGLTHIDYDNAFIERNELSHSIPEENSSLILFSLSSCALAAYYTRYGRKN